MKDSDVIRSATGAATVADDVSKQIIALLPVHAESLTPSREDHTQGTKGLFRKFKDDCGLDKIAGDVFDLKDLAKFVLGKYAEFDPNREKSGESATETVERYINDNGGRNQTPIKTYIDEYRAILDKEYPDTPEGYEKLRSALVDRNGKIVTIVKDFETVYNRVNNPSRKRNLQNAQYMEKGDWSAQAVSITAKFFINCQGFYFRIMGFFGALSDKCSHNPSLKD